MSVLNEVEQVRDQEGETAPPDMELIRLVDSRHQAPVLEERMPVDIRQLLKRGRDILPEFGIEIFKDISRCHVMDDGVRIDVVVLPRVRCAKRFFAACRLEKTPSPQPASYSPCNIAWRRHTMCAHKGED